MAVHWPPDGQVTGVSSRQIGRQTRPFPSGVQTRVALQRFMSSQTPPSSTRLASAGHWQSVASRASRKQLDPPGQATDAPDRGSQVVVQTR
jgi:hypothetical protein